MKSIKALGEVLLVLPAAFLLGLRQTSAFDLLLFVVIGLVFTPIVGVLAFVAICTASSFAGR